MIYTTPKIENCAKHIVGAIAPQVDGKIKEDSINFVKECIRELLDQMPELRS
jgi:hypothetical protein